MRKRTAAVITVSDRCSRGERRDTSGPALEKLLRDAGYDICAAVLVPDEAPEIAGAIRACADEGAADLVVTTGGTGFSRRDVTPEATRTVLEREAPGLAEAMRAKSLAITPMAALSRGVCGIRGGSVIVNLPGSEKAARENLEAILPALAHGIGVLRGEDTDCGAHHAGKEN